MKRTLFACVFLSTAGIASADTAAIRDEAEINGISEREMRMISGAPTTYANYRTSYWQVRDKLRRQALADARYLEEREPRVERVVVERPVVERELIEAPADTAETYALPDN